MALVTWMPHTDAQRTHRSRTADARVDARRQSVRVTQSAVLTIMAERQQMENYGSYDFVLGE